jgi:hypothetical protein
MLIKMSKLKIQIKKDDLPSFTEACGQTGVKLYDSREIGSEMFVVIDYKLGTQLYQLGYLTCWFSQNPPLPSYQAIEEQKKAEQRSRDEKTGKFVKLVPDKEINKAFTKPSKHGKPVKPSK